MTDLYLTAFFYNKNESILFSINNEYNNPSLPQRLTISTSPLSLQWIYFYNIEAMNVWKDILLVLLNIRFSFFSFSIFLQQNLLLPHHPNSVSKPMARSMQTLLCTHKCRDNTSPHTFVFLFKSLLVTIFFYLSF